MKELGKLLKPGSGLLVHTDWPESSEHPDGMTDKKAKQIYAMGGLDMQSMDITKLDTTSSGISQETRVFCSSITNIRNVAVGRVACATLRLVAVLVGPNPGSSS